MEPVTTPNPLLLDVVLDNVFPMLDLPTLLNCRLVCKCWCENSGLKTTIREKSSVSLRCIFLHTSTTKENISNYFQPNNGIIYSRYYFEHISYQNTLVSKVFEVMGKTISILQLHLDLNQLKMNQFRELIYERTPNLEELKIYNLSHEEIYYKQLFPELSDPNDLPKLLNLKRLELQETRSPIVTFMTEFMRTLPNLREITLKTDVCSDWEEQAEMWRQNSAIAKSVIEGLQFSEVFKTLKVFKCGKLLPYHVQTLLEMGERGMMLEVLELHVPPKEAEETFTRLLNTQSTSLKQLIMFEQRVPHFRPRRILGHPPTDQDFILKLPVKMEQLELLQFSKNYKAWMVPMKPVDYARQTPKLKTLCLNGYDGFGCISDYFGVSSQATCMVTSLVSHDHVSDSKIANLMFQSFPHLTKLSIRYPSPQFLTALWSSCPRIRDLTLILTDSLVCPYLDDVITGVDTRTIGYYLGRVKSYGQMKRLKEMGSQQKVACSIMNLTGLRRLRITVDHNENDERQALSDATAEFALRRMDQLRLLELYTSHWTLGLTSCVFFSHPCCERLKQDLKLTVIRFSPGDTESQEAALDYENENAVEDNLYRT
ncbi:hypothetical protein Ocin01_11522 [Orchesella cincta]|uniref:F-box domain-containing protein n=1 Tax=Orchesella cincta TaxID=48709 RepID=A0A1D2MPY0_ORCCI|nr:hypothetical protein Ocin01_11522 [Orchesella cincta]